MAGEAQSAPARTYVAKQGGETVQVEVTQTGGGWHLTVTRSGACQAKVSGPAPMSGGIMHMTKDDEGRACELEFTPKEHFAEFIEDSCPLHPDNCRFDDLPILQPK
jgi:hypothetical protein